MAKKWFAQCGYDKTCWSRAKFAVLYKLVQFAKNCLKVVHPVQKLQNVLILGWKRCFVQTRAFCWKPLKSDGPVRKWKNVPISDWKRCFAQTRALCWKSLKIGFFSAKMTKHADLEIKALFCTNSCTLVKMAKRWFAQCGNDKTCWSRAQFAVLYKARAVC